MFTGTPCSTFSKVHKIQLGTAQTSIVAEEYRCHIKVNKVMMVCWQDEKRLVLAKIMQMDSMYFLIFQLSTSQK